MDKIKKILSTSLLVGSVILPISNVYAENIDKYLYVGGELGLSEPVVTSFVHKTSTTKFRLKQSEMYGGRIGYSFYPGMMIEVSGTHQPKYGLTYVLPSFNVPLPGGASITVPKTPGKTKVTSNVYTVNWIYELPPQFLGLKPYAIVGAGVAKISVKPTVTTTDALAPIGLGNSFKFFRLRKSNTNCLTWQAGGGIAKDIAENFSIDVGAKLQVVNDIKIKYDKFDIKTQSFISQSPIKKTIGVWEFTAGFTFKIPLK